MTGFRRGKAAFTRLFLQGFVEVGKEENREALKVIDTIVSDGPVLGDDVD